MGKPKSKQQQFCGFVACLHVLFFAANGLNTINIPTTVDVQGFISLTD